MDIKNILSSQQRFFESNQTKDISFRLEQLKKLSALIKENEVILSAAVRKDLGKPPFEFYTTEIVLLYNEINFYLKNIKKWSQKKPVKTNLFNFPGRSYTLAEPLGATLIIGPWNYPVQLCLLPLISAIAAGNTSIIKPSELTPHTSRALADLINKSFSAEYLYVQEGGVPETTELLSLRFDKIFFTGSTMVGKIVALAAAKNLTPCTLELGGKSPSLVLKDADLKVTARRIAWGKFLNAGQTCVATDYILVDQAVEKELIEELKTQISNIYPNGFVKGETYTQIVNDQHYSRLLGLIDQSQVVFGGGTQLESRVIEPTILSPVNWSDKIMSEEIFGPILPILSFTHLDTAIAEIKAREKPLALYVFTKNSNWRDKVLKELSFGGGCVNDTIMHLSNEQLPFGGVGHSGLGSYHGKWGFDAFSHHKSLVEKAFWFDPFIKYQPYTAFKNKLIRMISG